ncbi:MAG: ATP-binding protein [Oscillospiraceae bacterium]
MKIAVLSGKGGTGKTFVAVNLAVCENTSVYLDCDVEEPNGHLFMKPENIQKEQILTLLPSFDETKCTKCRKCVDFCRFNALALVGKKPKVFNEVCHSCGGCSLICPSNAISEFQKQIGVVETGNHGNVTTVSGFLNPGEASGIPVIKAVLNKANPNVVTIIDCPPGSACSVMESIEGSDYCILVAEPTVFGLHNFEMVYELVSLLKKPCGVIINKSEGEYAPIDDFCKQHSISILCHIPYSEELALLGANAEIACEQVPKYKSIFSYVLRTVKAEVTK